MFYRYSLRTTDAEAGRSFYAAALGMQLPSGADDLSPLEAWPLHERARALGAPAHWLGHIAVDDAQAVAARIVELGGERLGPIVEVGDGTRYATVRDPFGAVVSVRQCAARAQQAVGWHQLHTLDAERAVQVYGELFGWRFPRSVAVADPEGGHRLFTFGDDTEPAGSIANTARWAGVHTHWLFYFPVVDIAAATARVRDLGGTARDVVELEGRRLSACEDPQGAAFGLVSRSP